MTARAALKRVGSRGNATNPFAKPAAEQTAEAEWTPQELAAFEKSQLAGERVLIHAVEDSDTFAGIALQYGVELAQLRQWNNLFQTDSLHLRRRLVVVVRACANDAVLQRVHDGELVPVTLPHDFQALAAGGPGSAPGPRAGPVGALLAAAGPFSPGGGPQGPKTPAAVLRDTERDLAALIPPAPAGEHGRPGASGPGGRALSGERPPSHRHTLGDLSRLELHSSAQFAPAEPGVMDALFRVASRLFDAIDAAVSAVLRALRRWWAGGSPGASDASRETLLRQPSSSSRFGNVSPSPQQMLHVGSPDG